MLVKVRLPSSFQPPKLPHMPNLSMSDVDLTLSALPSSSTILASILALFVLLSFVRALTIGLREHLAFVRGRKASLLAAAASSAVGVGSASSAGNNEKKTHDQRPTTSWLWGLVKAFPPSPAALTPKKEESSSPSTWPPTQAMRVNTHTASRKPGGPAYERPLATLYQSEMPVSMAKMIMSRHTFRRPSSRPPPARSTTGIQIQVQRRSPPPPPPQVASASTPAPPAPAPPTTATIPPTSAAPIPTPNNVPSIPSSTTTTTATTTTTHVSPTPKPNQPKPRVVIPQPMPKSPLYRPVSPPSRSPSPPSASRSPSPTKRDERERRSRTPSPVEEWAGMHMMKSVGGVERRESEIV